MVGAGLALTLPALQSRVAQLKSSEGESSDSKSEALRDYATAIEQLELAAEWEERAKGLVRLQREGPALLEANRARAETWSRTAPSTFGLETSKVEVEALLAVTEAKLTMARRSFTDVESKHTRLGERRMVLPLELAQAEVAQQGQFGEIDLPSRPTGSAEITLGRRAVAMARRRAAAEQVRAIELELATYDMRRELLVSQRELLRRQVGAYNSRVTELQALLGVLRSREAEEAAAAARENRTALERIDPALGTLAQENAELTAARTGKDGLSARMEAATRRLGAVNKHLEELEERSKGVRQKAATAGLTEAIGLLLRKELSDLQSAEHARADLRARREEIAAIQLQSLTSEDLLDELPEVEERVEAILAAQPESMSAKDRKNLESAARNMVRTRRASLDSLVQDLNSYFVVLVDLDAAETKYLRVLENYQAFLDQHVLWIPNASLPRLAGFAAWPAAIVWLTDPSSHAEVARRIAASSHSRPITTAATSLFLVGIALLYRRRLKRQLAKLCERRSAEKDALLPAPVAAVLVVALLACPGPLALWTVGWLIRIAPMQPDAFSTALASALQVAAIPLFVGEVLRRSAGPNGLAASFLDWPRAALAALRSQILFAEAVALPAFALATLFDGQPEAEWNETMGRALFCLAIGVVGLTAHRMFTPRGLIADQVLRHADLEWMRPVFNRFAWVPAFVSMLVIGMAAWGYYYTAFILVDRLWWSSVVLLLFFVANAASLRWLAEREARSLRELTESQDSAEDEGEFGASVAAAQGSVQEAGENPAQEAAKEAAAAVARDTAQTRSALRIAFGVLLAVGLFTAWADVFPALRFFESVELWRVSSTVEQMVGTGDASHLEQTIVQVPITVANLLLALFGAVLAVVGARNLPGLLELVVLSRLKLDRGLRYAIATVSRYVVFVLGGVLVLKNLGVGWSNVQWLVAAVSVGLGFGLQEIFGNFVSGLILLFERPVRVGDMVTVDTTIGTVNRIEMRATTIMDLDRKEVIIPNKELITGRLVNWSLHDTIVRLVIPVGVAYGSDTATVGRLLAETAKQSASVLETPKPMVFFCGFGDSSLDFELRVFIVNSDVLASTRHELLMSIDQKFRAAGIEIPFPQRDLHLRTVDGKAAAALTPNDPRGRMNEETP